MQQTHKELVPQPTVKPKNYKIKNSEWYCSSCEIYCNSNSQFEVHMVSTKHSLVERRLALGPEYVDNNRASDSVPKKTDAVVLDKSADDKDRNNLNNNKKTIDINNFEIAAQFKVDARAYLIPEEKKVGKFEKFGFYCSKCDAYMTGQIQLVMHIKGAKHQYYSPGELPDYQPSKVFNPNGSHYQTSRRRWFIANQNFPAHYQTNNNINFKLGLTNGFIRLPTVPSSAASTAQTILMAQAAAALANQRRSLLKSVAAAAAAAAAVPSGHMQLPTHLSPNYPEYLVKYNDQFHSMTPPPHAPQLNPESPHGHHIPQAVYHDSHIYHQYTPPPHSIQNHLTGSPDLGHFQHPTAHLYHHPFPNNLSTNSNGYRFVHHPVTAQTTTGHNSFHQNLVCFETHPTDVDKLNSSTNKTKPPIQFLNGPTSAHHSPNRTVSNSCLTEIPSQSPPQSTIIFTPTQFPVTPSTTKPDQSIYFHPSPPNNGYIISTGDNVTTNQHYFQPQNGPSHQQCY